MRGGENLTSKKNMEIYGVGNHPFIDLEELFFEQKLFDELDLEACLAISKINSKLGGGHYTERGVFWQLANNPHYNEAYTAVKRMSKANFVII